MADLTDAYLSNANLRGADFERTTLVRASLFDADLAGLSLSNTVLILELFGFNRVKSTVHNWVHKAELQPEDGHSPDHVAVDETVIRLDDEQYWLYAAVDPETNELLHTKLEPTRTNVLAHAFFTELREKHDVDDVPRTALQFSWARKTSTSCERRVSRRRYDPAERRLHSSRPRFPLRETRKSQQRRTRLSRGKTQN
jgi:transposase-like protein